jgi:hypothetical protein
LRKLLRYQYSGPSIFNPEVFLRKTSGQRFSEQVQIAQ